MTTSEIWFNEAAMSPEAQRAASEAAAQWIENRRYLERGIDIQHVLDLEAAADRADQEAKDAAQETAWAQSELDDKESDERRAQDAADTARGKAKTARDNLNSELAEKGISPETLQ